jgi:hypothetical protein
MRRPALAFVAIATLFACHGEEVRPHRDPPDAGVPTCGDGRADPGEECDGSDLRGSSCTTLGFNLGSVSCDSQCRLVTSACVKLCGNGRIDPGEACDGTTGALTCADWGYKVCTGACTVDALHCRADPFRSGTPISQPHGGPAIIADLAPPGRGDLVIPDPELVQLQLYSYELVQGFVEGSAIARTDRIVPSVPIAADLDGDGRIDLAALNVDGSADRYLYVPPGQSSGQYVLQHLLDPPGISCPMLQWIGAFNRHGGGGDDLAALACPGATTPAAFGGVLIHPGEPVPAPAEWIPQPGTLAAALADFDGDGSADLLLIQGDGSLVVRFGPAFDVASAPLPLGSTPSRIAAGDLDGDGDADVVITSSGAVSVLENMGTSLVERSARTATGAFAVAVRDLDLDGRADVVWLADGEVEVLRNLGGFVFATHVVFTGPGTPVSLALGDFEGDGDTDIAATVIDPPGGAGTTTHVLENLVR